MKSDLANSQINALQKALLAARLHNPFAYRGGCPRTAIVARAKLAELDISII